MARLAVEGNVLEVRLSWLERFGACVTGDLAVPLSAIRSVEVTREPWSVLRGIRAPGTGLRGVIALGTRRHSLGRDFVAVYGKGPAVVIRLGGLRFAQLVISSAEAERAADEIGKATGAARRSALNIEAFDRSAARLS